MTISANCLCGKKYQLKDDSAGKKFQCKECGKVVTVPEEQLDDLEDYKEDSEDEEFDVPVRRVKKYRGRSNRRKSQSSGPHPILRVTGIICGIVGFIFAVLYYIAAVVWLFLLLTMMSVRNLSPLFPMVAIGIVVFSIFIGFVTWRAAQLACGMNYEGVTQGWSEQSKIIAGIVVICVPSICMALLRYFNPEMSLISVG